MLFNTVFWGMVIDFNRWAAKWDELWWCLLIKLYEQYYIKEPSQTEESESTEMCQNASFHVSLFCLLDTCIFLASWLEHVIFKFSFFVAFWSFNRKTQKTGASGINTMAHFQAHQDHCISVQIFLPSPASVGTAPLSVVPCFHVASN